jgi:dolichol-phosphate mannosyltransferase
MLDAHALSDAGPTDDAPMRIVDGNVATPVVRPIRDDVVVVVPTYNELDNIAPISRAVLEQGFRLLIVDDNSPDGTGTRADAIAGDVPDHRMHVLHRPGKMGLGPAYAAGFAWALEHDASIMCEMDADFSHDPHDLRRLVAAVDAGADLAIGSRYVPGGGVTDWPWHRRALSRGGNLYAGLMLGTPVRDMTAGFRAFRADAVRATRPEECKASGYAFQIEMVWRAHLVGLQIIEVPITFRDRLHGHSKMDGAIAKEAIRLITGWGSDRFFGRLPLRPE